MSSKGLQINYDNILAEKISTQHGLCPSDLTAYESQVAEIIARMNAGKDDPPQYLGWMNFPKQDLRPFLALAKRRAKTYQNIIMIGIGGSALGPRAIHKALHNVAWNEESSAKRGRAPKAYFLENIDPEQTKELLAAINIAESLVIVSSKSGNTPETLANLAIVRQRLIKVHGKDSFAKHIIAITEEGDGALYHLAKKEGYELFLVSSKIGGRYAVLGPVGLVPSALLGMDINNLLAGAADMAKRCRSQKLMVNPAALLATIQYLLYAKKEKNLTVLFSYAHHLSHVTDWYRQLLAESTGKELNNQKQKVHTGITPVRAVGTIDQHSQLQLYNEGANDKLIILVTPDKFHHDFKIPSLGNDSPNVDYLNNQSYTKLFKVEAYVTQLVLTNYHRPNLLISIPEINAYNLGQLFYFFEMQVAILCQLLNINPFNQPGVELGKDYTKTFMRSNESF